MQTLQIWIDLFESRVYVVHVVCLWTQLWHLVVPTFAELLTWLNIRIYKILDHSVDEPNIFVISNPPSLVNVGYQHLHDTLWHFVKLLNVDAQLPFARSEFFGHEALGDVPADWSEAFAITCYGMEYRYGKQ